MKLVKEVLSKVKGEQEVLNTLTGKGSFSKQGFSDLTNALVNDNSFKVKCMGKNGEENFVSISELIRNDMKKTITNAQFPQKSEIGVIDTCEISTTGLAEAIPHILMEQLRCGKKFDLPNQTDMVGSIYLSKNAGKVRTVQVRDITTKEELGTSTITTQDSVQIRTKSPVPKHLQSKIRKDVNGNLITK